MRHLTTNSGWPRIRVPINDNYCVMKGFCECGRREGLIINVTGKKQTFVNSYRTLNVSSPVASHILIARGLPQKRGVNPDIVQQKSLKYVKEVSSVDHLCFVQNVRNVPIVTPDLPVGARLHQFLEIWAALGASPKS